VIEMLHRNWLEVGFVFVYNILLLAVIFLFHFFVLFAVLLITE